MNDIFLKSVVNKYKGWAPIKRAGRKRTFLELLAAIALWFKNRGRKK